MQIATDNYIKCERRIHLRMTEVRLLGLSVHLIPPDRLMAWRSSSRGVGIYPEMSVDLFRKLMAQSGAPGRIELVAVWVHKDLGSVNRRALVLVVEVGRSEVAVEMWCQN